VVVEPLGIDAAIAFLNGLVEVDPKAVTALVELRVACNEEMADHPTVQVQADTDGGNPEVGILGVLNGLFGTYDKGAKEGWGPITAVFYEGMVVEFRRTQED